MPAVTVDDLSTLPRISAPTGPSSSRPVKRITTALHDFEGLGFPVRRAFTGVSLAELDPFVHLDQIGEVNYGPGEPKGTPWHPHRGFETVTYMMDGELRHEDSTGGGGLIANGGTQWMTAGKGILHIETPPEHVVAVGGLFHGLQLWVNLASAKKWVEPRYQDLEPEAVTLLSSADGGALVRVIAGVLGAHRGPGSTRSPINMIHATLAPGARLILPWPSAFNALGYVLAGSARVGSERRPLQLGQLAVFGEGQTLSFEAPEHLEGPSASLELLVLGGAPIGEPVAWMGPFVMNTEAELRQAFEDFHAGKLGQIPAAHLSPSDDLDLQADSPLD